MRADLQSNAILRAIRNGLAEMRLPEPFTAANVAELLPTHRRTRIVTFLAKHREGNPGGYKVLFRRVAPAKYCLHEGIRAEPPI